MLGQYNGVNAKCMQCVNCKMSLGTFPGSRNRDEPIGWQDGWGWWWHSLRLNLQNCYIT